MTDTKSISKRIRERKCLVNIDINHQIKKLQKRLVTLSFSKNLVSKEYRETLRKINLLRVHRQ